MSSTMASSPEEGCCPWRSTSSDTDAMPDPWCTTLPDYEDLVSSWFSIASDPGVKAGCWCCTAPDPGDIPDIPYSTDSLPDEAYSDQYFTNFDPEETSEAQPTVSTIENSGDDEISIFPFEYSDLELMYLKYPKPTASPDKVYEFLHIWVLNTVQDDKISKRIHKELEYSTITGETLYAASAEQLEWLLGGYKSLAKTLHLVLLDSRYNGGELKYVPLSFFGLKN
ncbi:uncharacterized protein GIQ15_03061 [Arthroderma uncinatum]|uniref:uncharacterized protein n=1 Tax=Arthroderma uncinatum TaxID=74035 RepID=UPI00144A6F1E|nr:uncharacterized protein GIQ15_03061 [Arthroderma uncinatum]KAF3483737.1 hypothetical protein GIQ15_03061 [Arthroderma uncinatum]